ncbi:hypothetical protein KR026_008702 [Drosophila bipectinata]|nr:hypothetical protein KR026_008702 [Drosophila bipectinata]
MNSYSYSSQFLKVGLQLLNRPVLCHLGTSSTSGPEPEQTNPLQLSAGNYKYLLGAENRIKCMENMHKLPVFKRPRGLPPSDHEKNFSSVLIALCQERGKDEVSLLYTRRSRNLRSHSLHPSFPGGRMDQKDASYVACALRETEEEIGLPGHRVQVWGESMVIHLPRTSSIVPVVGVIADFDVAELRLNHDEVEEVFTVPLNSMIQPQATRHTQFRSGYSIPAFQVEPRRVWGITAYLTNLFLHSLLPASLRPDCLKNNVQFVRPFKTPWLAARNRNQVSDNSMRD